jgi:hypothetical protein
MTVGTAQAPHVSPFDQRARQRRLEEALRRLHGRGWEQRLARLAQHMSAQRLVRSCGYAGAPVRIWT